MDKRTVRFEPEFYNKIKNQAIKERRTAAQVIRYAVQIYLEHFRKPDLLRELDLKSE